MSAARSRARALAASLATVMAVSLSTAAASGTAPRSRSTPARALASCAQSAEETGLEQHLRDIVTDTSADGPGMRDLWKLPSASASVVSRVLVDSVCAQAIAGYNTVLIPSAPRLTDAFVYKVDTLYVVEPITSGGKHFKLIVVLNSVWQHVAAIAS